MSESLVESGIDDLKPEDQLQLLVQHLKLQEANDRLEKRNEQLRNEIGILASPGAGALQSMEARLQTLEANFARGNDTNASEAASGSDSPGTEGPASIFSGLSTRGRPPPPQSKDLAVAVTALEELGMTNQQVAKAHEFFELYDRDSSGTISIDDVLELLHFLGDKSTREEVEAAVNDIDQNLNGDLELNEFLILYSRLVASHDAMTVDGDEYNREGVDLLRLSDYGVFAMMRWVKYAGDGIGGNVTGPLVPCYRATARSLVLRRDLEIFFYICIVISAVISGVETDPDVADTSLVVSLSDATLTIFAVEVVLKWVADTGSMRSTFAFLSDGWNAFDVAILLSQVVLVVLLPALDVDSVMDSGHAARALRILRLVRSLRMLRAAKIVPELMLVMETLLRSLSSVGYIMAFTMLVSYVFAIIGVTLFGKNDPFHFGSIHVAMLSLFRIATQEDWTDIMYFNMYGCNGWGDYDAVVEVNTKACEHTSHYVSAPVYFICYIICATFLLLNLFLAVIVNSMMETKEETKLRKQEAKAWAVATRIKVKTDISLKGMGMSGIKAGMGAARKGLAKAGVELGSTPAGQKGFETEAGSSKAKGKKKAKGGAKEFDNPISKLS